MNKRYSLHHIHSADEFTFSPAEYSYFKYGDKSYAEKFAKELFDGFISGYNALLDTDKEIVVLPSPYMAIPTASNFFYASFFKKHFGLLSVSKRKEVKYHF
ncbi:phosphoribosyltransferase family protein [Chryseobacterium sp. P1-3]|uniref:phosphoribosyltransferase family protein n=1 Tax=Chryseobacterium sp. (strain P1-3) TaxID=1517683 RepID=UPI000A4140DD|nr:phosphoribosyltransferase family protein [Chryseobacterium sp. P1-3]